MPKILTITTVTSQSEITGWLDRPGILSDFEMLTLKTEKRLAIKRTPGSITVYEIFDSEILNDKRN